ncbi:hypothetical protein Purlil1_231 [Purpureocillium lilacinum]|uniref:Uncharacterized protein n=1 Tax=Purpureocillium lilacinum TaxID=33203 RepID=A0ABR0CH71_PURLI|nr:hypothetical protein Purlil1_231 [Purpureocillium lilacinum]
MSKITPRNGLGGLQVAKRADDEAKRQYGLQALSRDVYLGAEEKMSADQGSAQPESAATCKIPNPANNKHRDSTSPDPPPHMQFPALLDTKTSPCALRQVYLCGLAISAWTEPGAWTPRRHGSTPCPLLSSALPLSVAGCFIRHLSYLDLMPIPSPPPPPPPPAFESVAPRPTPRPPTVPPDGPAGAFQVQLFVFNASPFKDHWAYFVRSNARHTQGVVLHATGDVNNGFRLEFKRLHDLDTADEVPSEIIPLQWVDAQYFDESAMLNNGNPVIDTVPACAFEVSACKVKAPGKSLNSASTNVGASIALADAFGVPLSNAEPRKKVVQRNCQTWIVESADQLVADGIFSREVAAFLHASEQ